VAAHRRHEGYGDPRVEISGLAERFEQANGDRIIQ
jgi:hypothetical protein